MQDQKSTIIKAIGFTALAVLLAMLISLTAAANEQASSNETFVPTKLYKPWTRWTPNRQSGFDILRCETLSSGDVNGDGKMDLICVYDYGNDQTRTFVQISSGSGYTLWQNWTGDLQSQFDVNRCRAILTGDVNRDGLTDTICPYDYSGSLTRTFVQLSSGSDFTNWQNWSGETQRDVDLKKCKSVHAGDVNGDRRADLICVAEFEFGLTKTYHQISSGTDYSDWEPNLNNALQGGIDIRLCTTIQPGDVNRDRKTDMICSYDHGNDGTSTYAQLWDGSRYSVWKTSADPQAQFDVTRCRAVRTGDVNGDGLTDLICPYDYDNDQTRTWVQLSNGMEFLNWENWTGDLQTQFDLGRCADVHTGDINGDGWIDLICPYNYGNDQTRTFVQIGTGLGYTFWQNWSADFQNQFDLDRCHRMQAGDVTGDGLTELVCPYNYGGNLTATFVQKVELHQIYLPILSK